MNVDPIYVYERETDPEVVARHGGPARPITRRTVRHPVLGVLTWSEVGKEWRGERKRGRGSYEIAIRAGETDEAKRDRAAAGAVAIEQRLAELGGFAADALLGLLNREWREAGEAPVRRDTFVKRLRPATRAFDEDGSVRVFFSDGELFGGHSVVVELDSDLRPVDATI